MKYLVIFILTSISTKAVLAQNADVKGHAAYLFAYYPKENARQHFENGYKKHLLWHAANNDPLVWYAWYVQSGDRLGMFIDGTFGISHEAFGNRVDPAGDRQDFQQTTAPFADPVFRKVYVLMPELSTVQLLEAHTPSEAIEVYNFVVHPGAEALFEEIMANLQKVLDKEKFRWTIYKLLSGGEHGGYMLMVPGENAAYFDRKEQITSLSNLILKNFPTDRAHQLNQELLNAIRQMTSETWSYRADLSLIPE